METKKSWSLLELSSFCEDEEKVLSFLRDRGLIPQSMNCPKCGWGMRIIRSQKLWKCYKTLKTKKGKKVCGKKLSLHHGTWFSRTKLSYKQVLTLTYMLVHNYEQKAIVRELKIRKTTVSQWNSFIQQVLMEWLKRKSEPIGGEGKTVEVYAGKLRKRKYNRGRVFGGICRETKKVFLVLVKDRTSTTLISLIKQWILPGSAIMLHSLEGCVSLSEEGYEHLRMNHSVTFIDSNTGTLTNLIKSIWSHTKEFSLSYRRQTEKFIAYLAHFMFMNDAKKKHKDLFDCILQEISEIKFSDSQALDEGIESDEGEERDSEGDI